MTGHGAIDEDAAGVTAEWYHGGSDVTGTACAGSDNVHELHVAVLLPGRAARIIGEE